MGLAGNGFITGETSGSEGKGFRFWFGLWCSS